jgi:adenylylsulfate kinase-like enzyme
MTSGVAVEPGLVVWVTGLSGSGKSTVAAELKRLIQVCGRRPVVLDGDELRTVLGVTSFDDTTRHDLGLLYGRLCRLLSDQGHLVICATISLRHEVHAWNRAHLPRYLEVFLQVPLEEVQRRDPKGVYRRAAAGRSIVGLDGAAEFPAAPDLTLPNFGRLTSAAAAERIFQLCAIEEGR